MASSIAGVVRRLNWTQFPVRNIPRPKPGESALAAQTRATFKVNGISTTVASSARPVSYRLADTIAVMVRLKMDECWVAGWTVDRATPEAEKQRLLKHEQGHYDIVALVSRALFDEMTDLLADVFASAQEAVDAATAVIDRLSPYAQSLQELYDDKTDHGDDSSEQSRWNAMFTRAFVSSGSGAAVSKDRRTPLIDVLKDARILN